MSERPDPRGKLPRALVRLLEHLLPADRVDDVLGDLAESLERRPARSRAGLRLWWEAAALVVWRIRDGIDQRALRQGRGGMGRDLLQDLRFGFRTLSRRPGFALVAVGVMGLGIAAPTTVLTLVDRIFFERPAHVVEPHRLVTLYRSFGPGRGGGSLGNPDYVYYRDNQGTLSGLAAHGGAADATFTTGDGTVEQISISFTSDNYFSVLGVRPARGRFFQAEENATRGTHPVIVLSHGLWQRAFGGDPGVVGSSLVLTDIRFTVVGVAPEGFRGLTPLRARADAWAPIAMYGAVSRAGDTAWWERSPNSRSNWLRVVGRLAPGVTFEAAESNLTALADALEYEGKDEAEGLMVSRQYLYHPAQASQLATLSRMLLASVAIVLAVAIGNVAVLLLSRTATRGREIGVRMAMGARRGRVFRQLLAESLLLGVVGGALGIAIAYVASDAAASLLPLAFEAEFTPRVTVLALAVALSIVTAVLAGLAPALHSTRRDVAAVIDDPRVAGSRSRMRDTLVVGQVALSLVLVAGAILFTRSFWTARTEELGWDERGRLLVTLDLRSEGYDAERGRAFIRQALDRLGAIPGVEGVTTTRMVPFRGDWSTDFEASPERFPRAVSPTVWIGLNVVAPGYFDLMDVPIVRGRPLGPDDGEGAAPAIVVNETLARQLWPGEDPIGRSVPLIRDEDLTVVGVARDATYYELGEEPVAQAYGSVLQVYQPDVTFIVGARTPTVLVPAVREALRSLDPAIPIGEVTTLEAVVEEQTARYEVSAVLVGLFGALALALASAGLYGLISFFVAQRTREIGVRIALGAGRARVAREVLATGARLAVLGGVLGLAGAVVLRRFTASLLYGVAPTDPWSLAGACATLAAVMVLAVLAPARRAARVDPLEAMRVE